jgi:hypothetical protein
VAEAGQLVGLEAGPARGVVEDAVIIEACECDGLPPHDHPVRYEHVDGRLEARYVPDEYHFWVDWRAVAHALMTERDGG